MNGIQTSDEIDLIRLIKTIWDGKWKIIAITTACVLGVLGFQILGPAPSFVATTKITPILSGDAEDYRQLNDSDFFAVYRDVEARDQAQLSAETIDANKDKDRDRDRGRDRNKDRARDRRETPSAVLDQLFIEQLGNHSLLASTFKKHGLLLRKEFDSDEDYEFSLTQLTATISVLPPVNKDGTLRGESRRHWTLTFKFNDQDKWLSALEEIKNTANKNVRDAVKARFENLHASARQKREFEIEDLNSQISVLIAAYDTEIASRLAHLKEQAVIARKLEISKQTNIPQPSIYQSLNTQEDSSLGFGTRKIGAVTPPYLRGYVVLEKEIELINSRQDKRAFIEGLLPLEQKKLIVLKDQTPERARRLFAKTPVMRSGDFQSASFDVAATKFEYKGRRTLALALAAVVGSILGMVHVLVANAMRSRRETEMAQR